MPLYNTKLISWIRITPNEFHKGLVDIIYPHNKAPNLEEIGELIKAGFVWTNRTLMPNHFCWRGTMSNLPNFYY